MWWNTVFKSELSTGFVFAVSHLNTHRQQGENVSEEWGSGAEESYTYIEISCTVKAILIGHHTERQRQREEKGKEVQRSGGGKRKQKGCDAPPCGHCGKQQTRARKQCQTDGGWQREEKEGWDYYTPCNMQDKIPSLCILNTLQWYMSYYMSRTIALWFMSTLRHKEMVFHLTKLSISQWKYCIFKHSMQNFKVLFK